MQQLESIDWHIQDLVEGLRGELSLHDSQATDSNARVDSEFTGEVMPDAVKDRVSQLIQNTADVRSCVQLPSVHLHLHLCSHSAFKQLSRLRCSQHTQCHLGVACLP